MTSTTLVTYASQYGATKEIAETIADVLSQSGVQADVAPVDTVKDLSPYRAVILGSGIYAGKWPNKSAKFLQDNEKSLSQRMTWIFTSGPTGEGDPVKLMGYRLPAPQQSIADRIHPCDVTVFHGNINPKKVNFLLKFVIKNIVKAPFGDYRDCDMIAAWALGIAEELNATEPIQ